MVVSHVELETAGVLEAGAQFNWISTDCSTWFSTECLVLQSVLWFVQNSVERPIEIQLNWVPCCWCWRRRRTTSRWRWTRCPGEQSRPAILIFQAVAVRGSCLMQCVKFRVRKLPTEDRKWWNIFKYAEIYGVLLKKYYPKIRTLS